MTAVENICAKLGCIMTPCCENTEFVVPKAEAQRFIQGLEVHYLDPTPFETLSDFQDNPGIPHGVLYIQNPLDTDPDMVTILIKGPCPRQNPVTKFCDAFMMPQRFNICSEVPAGHWYCNFRRSKAGLPTVQQANAAAT